MGRVGVHRPKLKCPSGHQVSVIQILDDLAYTCPQCNFTVHGIGASREIINVEEGVTTRGIFGRARTPILFKKGDNITIQGFPHKVKDSIMIMGKVVEKLDDTEVS